MQTKKINHYIVSGAPWNDDGIRYRRNRLSEYLKNDSNTVQVYFICPVGISVRNTIGSIKRFKHSTGKLPNGIIQIGLPDYRGLMRYGGLLRRFIRRMVRNWFNKNDNRKYIWFTDPSYADLATAFPWDKIIYDCSDLWNREGTGPSKYSSELNIIIQSDIIFATSDYLRNTVYRMGKKNAYVVENGVAYDSFRTAYPEQLDTIPTPRIGFAGSLKFKIDYDLLIYLAEKLPHVSLVLIGPNDDRDDTFINGIRQYKNIFWLGKVPYKNIPGYIKALDTGILPYKNVEYNNAVSPLKLFEYLAAGIPAVGTGLPSTEKYSSEGVYYYTNNGYKDFAEKCLDALQRKDDLKYRDKRLETAAMHDWNTKFQYMLDIVMGDTLAGKEHCTGNTTTSIRSITY